jgi:hypothetical protein
VSKPDPPSASTFFPLYFFTHSLYSHSLNFFLHQFRPSTVFFLEAPLDCSTIACFGCPYPCSHCSSSLLSKRCGRILGAMDLLLFMPSSMSVETLSGCSFSFSHQCIISIRFQGHRAGPYATVTFHADHSTI